jgi:preprotein translocase subunit SecE
MASEEKNADAKAENADSPLQARTNSALSFIPNKFGELKTFLTDVRSELKRVTWPPKTEVYPTTIVVVVTTVIFGVLLYAVDVLFSRGLAALLQLV